MSIIGNSLPQVQNRQRPEGLRWDAPAELMQAWSGTGIANAEDGPVIDMFEQIGEDWWDGSGVTAKAVTKRLEAFAGQEIKVRINSPGGDVFEGLAIYNLIAQHDAKVVVEVLGLAASAASIIAMAGDEILMGAGAKMMIHNAWGVAVGNRNDMRSVADILEGIDAELAGIYQARSGGETEAIAKMMDDETWMNADEALSMSFATGKSAAKTSKDTKKNQMDSPVMARRAVEAALAAQGYPRNQRSQMLSRMFEGSAKRDATDPEPAARDAGTTISTEEFSALMEALKVKD